MSKVYFFQGKLAEPSGRSGPILPDVYCPVGGYRDKGLDKTFASRGEKYRYLRAHGLREAEPINPNTGIGGTEGCSIKRRGSPGNFRARPMPSWMKSELARHVG